MATQNTRDVELRISATTSGDEQIRLLAQQLQALAKEGGEAAPEFKKLAGELDKIAAQSAAVQTIQTLQSEIEQTGVKVAEAATKVEQLGTAFRDQEAKTTAFRDAQAAARAAVDETEQKLRAAQRALNEYRVAQDQTGKSTADTRTKFKELEGAVAGLEGELKKQQGLADNKAKLDQIGTSLRSATAGYEAAVAQSAEYRAEIDKQAAALTTSQAAQAQSRAAIEATEQKLRDARNALNLWKAGQDEAARSTDAGTARFRELRLEVANLENQLRDQKALQTTGQAVRQIEGALREATSAFDATQKEAAKFRAEMDKQKGTLDETQRAQADATRAVVDTEQRLTTARAALTAYRLEQEQIATSAADAKARFTELRTEVAGLEAVLKDQKGLVATKTEVREVESALKQASKAYEAAKAEAAGFQAEVAKQKASLDAAQAALAATGVKAKELAAAQDEVTASMAATRAEVDRAATAYAKSKSGAETLAQAQKFLDAELEIQRGILTSTIEVQQRAAAAERELAAAKQQAAVAAQQQAQALKDQAAAAARALEESFAKTGVRSAQAIEREIREIIAALAKLRDDSTVTGADFDRAFASAEARVNKLQAELRQTPETLRKSREGVDFLTAGFRQLAAVYGAIELGQKFIDSNVQIEALRRSLTLVTGSTAEAGKQIALLQDVANKSGVSIGEISSSFIKFQTSLRSANIPLETTEGLFRAVVNASGQLGLSSQRTSLILDALSQTANKGTVSMEELRQQLGDSLPGAIDLTAKGLGITTAELVKLVENGKLLSADFLPALRKALVDSFGDGTKEVDGFLASWNRFKNALTATSQFIGDSGVFKGLTLALTAVAEVVRGATAAFEIYGRVLGTTYGAIASFDFRKPIQSFNNWKEAVKEVLDDVSGRFVRSNEVAEKGAAAVADAQKKSAAAIVDAGGKAGAAAGQFTTSANAQTGSAAAADKNAASQKASGDATKTAGDAAASASAQWVQLSLKYDEALKTAERETVVSEKLSAAKKIEGAARQQIADISGNEAEKIRVAALVRIEEAAALQKTAQSRQAEVAVLKEEKTQLEALLKTLGDSGGARAEQIKKIQQTIDVKTAEVEKSTQAAAAAEREALARKVALATYVDNSAALATLAAAYDKTKSAVEATEAAFAKGKATTDQVTAARQNATVAEALYRDAVADTNRNVTANNSLQSAKLSVTEAQIGVQRAQIQNEIALAQANGDTYTVLQKTVELKELDIEVIRAKNIALAAEARATIAAAQAELESLRVTNALTEAKRAEIEARILAARVKLLEVDKNKELIVALEREIALMRQRGTVSSEGANKFVGDRAKEAASLEAVADASEKAAEAERKRLNVDKSGFSLDKSGNRVTAEGQTWLSVFNQLKGRGLPDDAARKVANEFADSNGNIQYFNNPGQLKYGGAGSTIGVAVDRAAEKYLRNASEPGPGAQRPMSQSDPRLAYSGSSPQQSSQVYTVNINMNGNTTQVNTASQSDADALLALLRNLGSTASRTGP